MTQEEIDALATTLRNQGLTWNQTNFAVAVIRDYVEPLRQQLSTLKAELKCIGEAIDDPRTDLTMTMSEVIVDQKQQLSARRRCTQG